MRITHLLLRKQRPTATIVQFRMIANGNFSDISLERLHSVSFKVHDEPELPLTNIMKYLKSFINLQDSFILCKSIITWSDILSCLKF